MRAPVTIQISREEIASRDVSRVREILDSFNPVLLERNRNRVQIEIQGFGDDSLELFLINEVRRWFHALFDAVPEIFYWMDMSEQWFTYYTLMFNHPITTEGSTTTSAEGVQRFMLWSFENLNRFCSAHDVSPEPCNQHLKEHAAG